MSMSFWKDRPIVNAPTYTHLLNLLWKWPCYSNNASFIRDICTHITIHLAYPCLWNAFIPGTRSDRCLFWWAIEFPWNGRQARPGVSPPKHHHPNKSQTIFTLYVTRRLDKAHLKIACTSINVTRDLKRKTLLHVYAHLPTIESG